MSIGSKHGAAKLSESFVITIRRNAHQMGYCHVARLARANQVSYQAMSNAVKGISYTHINKVAKPFLGATRKKKGCVVRLVSYKTIGWQARIGAKSRFYADRKWGGSTAAQRLAKSWLSSQLNNGR